MTARFSPAKVKGYPRIGRKRRIEQMVGKGNFNSSFNQPQPPFQPDPKTNFPSIVGHFSWLKTYLALKIDAIEMR
jgi:hypothetical protein